MFLVVLYPKVDFLQKLGTLLNPFTPGNFAEKQVLSRLTICDLSHALVSWQLVSHVFSKSQTIKRFQSYRFVSKLNINK